MNDIERHMKHHSYAIIMYTGRWQTNKMCRLEAYYGIKRPWNRNKGGWKGATKGQLLARLQRHWDKTTGDNRMPEQRQQTQHVQQITGDEAQYTFPKARLPTNCFHRVFYFKYHI